MGQFIDGSDGSWVTKYDPLLAVGPSVKNVILWVTADHAVVNSYFEEIRIPVSEMQFAHSRTS